MKDQPTWAGICAAAGGKRQFLSRKAARSERKYPRLTPFRCDHCGYWHLGHLPPVVKRGRADRDTVSHGKRP